MAILAFKLKTTSSHEEGIHRNDVLTKILLEIKEMLKV